MKRSSYDHQAIEPALQKKWQDASLYVCDLEDETREKYYLLFEFPYPSGDLHIGHWYAFALTDIYARKLRMQGKNVLFPMGFDAFGLPAENAAIKRGVDPKEWTQENIATMREQMKSMGTSVDWSKEVISCDPQYYKWTQWLFTKFLEHGLAQRKEASVKWCPNDKTVLANEQVLDGHCERCGAAVEDKKMTQWFLKITQYADRLLKDLDGLAWPTEIKEAQRAWIGASEGAKITFPVHSGEGDIPLSVDVFTTRADTIFGATYLVLAPEHPLIDTLVQYARNVDEIRAYQRVTGKKTERERSENKEKTGVVLEGITATNPATKLAIPVYIADYVLASYGTGAVMAVPAHDERDYEFAKKYNLPIWQVVEPTYEQTTEPGKIRDGEQFDHREAIIAIVKHWSDDTYIALKWKDVAWGTFITGGIEEGQTPETAAKAELEEEVGYTDAEFVKDFGVVHGKFYHVPKKLNRNAHAHVVYLELKSDARTAISEKEAALHDVLWLSKEELRSFLTPDTHQHALRWLEGDTSIYTKDGTLANSGQFDRMESEEARHAITQWLGAEKVTNYRLRDWSVGRQRYWGCPIPVVYDPQGTAHAIPPEHLPWILPTDVDMTPGAAGEGKSPLASSKELKERVERIFGEGWTPEYDTLDTFVDSSWYFLRYLAPQESHSFSDSPLMKKWMPVDRYSGGSEHTTMHLLYARFFTKVLYDLALCPVSEPFTERLNRGIILGPDGAKMSKSKGNVINPDEMVSKYGADAVRMYLAFIGPYNEPGHYPWNLDGTFSMRKFLDRVYALSEKVSDMEETEDAQRLSAQTIDKVATDIDRFKFNTAISALMVCVRELENMETVPKQSYLTLLTLLAPFAPHLADHLYEQHASASVHRAAWPEINRALLASKDVTVVIQVAGRKRGEVVVSADASQNEVLERALALEGVSKFAGEGTPSRVIYVPNRLLNIVP